MITGYENGDNDSKPAHTTGRNGGIAMFYRNSWMYLMVALIAVGVFAGFARNPGGVLLPLAIFGIVFYLYKFPPKWLLRWAGRPHSASRDDHKRYQKALRTGKHRQNQRGKLAKRKRRKHYPFQVIDGHKKGWHPRRKSQ